MTINTEAYEAVIGLEVHTHLLTRSKIFCGCSTTFGAGPNENVCPICMGMPGVLPVLNRRVVELAIRTGLAAHCTIAPYSIFDRKISPLETASATCLLPERILISFALSRS